MITEDKGTQFDIYEPTGDLEKDFNELSAILAIPASIRERPKTPAELVTPESPRTPPPSTLGVGKRKEARPKSSVQETAVVFELPPSSTEGAGAEGEVPFTYLISQDDVTYFRPQVLFESEEENNKKHMKKLYLRGWLADSRVLNILSKTLPHLERLATLDMWNAGLTDETLASLNQCLSPCTSLKTLNLSGNHLAARQRFDMFVVQGKPLNLQNLSLRNCGIDADGALLLTNVLIENTSLLTLNISHNRIGDEGAVHIADCLKFNRTLLSLNLASNGIGDAGAKCIGETLTTFPLTHEQVIQRRQYSTTSTTENNDDRGKTTPSPSSQKKNSSNSIQVSKKTKTKSKGGRETKKDRTDNTKGGLRGKRGKGVSHGESFETPTPPPEDVPNPLYGKADLINGELWIQGNQTLINLNLSRNKITAKGLEVISTAIQQQNELIMPGNTRRTGLMRVSLQKNEFCASNNATYLTLCELLNRRDPLNNKEEAMNETNDKE